MNYEIVDHEVTQMSGLVIYVVDLWEGKRDDIATTVTRCLAAYPGGSLEKDGVAFDPSFEEAREPTRYGDSGLRPKPVCWTFVESVQEGDGEAENHRDAESWLEQEEDDSYYSRVNKPDRTRWHAFWEAIEKIGTEEETDETWVAVDSWRLRLDDKNEK